MRSSESDGSRKLRFCPGVEHTGNSEVVAFVSGHEDKAAKVGEKYGVKDLYSYDEYDNLLSSGTIDAVYLATPNWDHVDLAVRTLDAGIHLLLEKPMATSVEDCERIIAASDRSRRKADDCVSHASRAGDAQSVRNRTQRQARSVCATSTRRSRSR